DLELVTTTRWREAEVDVEAIADDLFPVAMARPLFSKHIQLFAYDPRPVIAALRRHQPRLIDLSHEPYSVACAEVLTLCNVYAPQATVVMQACQNIFHKYPVPFRWLERRALNRVAAAYVCSETVREVLVAKGFKKHVEIIPFGVNTEAFSQSGLAKRDPGEPLTIGFVGRMLPGKGLNLLSEALGLLAAEKWKLLVVGDGSERRSFESSLAAHDLLARARFTGAVSYEQVPELFRQIDLLVMPTETTERIREQFGRVLVEAMAGCIPVIGSTCGAIPEVISDAGLVFPEGDAKALAEAIRRMLSDPELRERCAVLGKARVEEHYSWDVVAEKTFAFFAQVLAGTAATDGNIQRARNARVHKLRRNSENAAA
ncbi:MAG TPA: glycosyltransferase family 4 protein, partial [Pyrinomonadaceae bacterium]|nr:glycosyltransferase family 4 protein [Pyrinomonadaceae bacterium]